VQTQGRPPVTFTMVTSQTTVPMGTRQTTPPRNAGPQRATHQSPTPTAAPPPPASTQSEHSIGPVTQDGTSMPTGPEHSLSADAAPVAAQEIAPTAAPPVGLGTGVAMSTGSGPLSNGGTPASQEAPSSDGLPGNSSASSGQQKLQAFPIHNDSEV
jgi:hypothetical protein